MRAKNTQYLINLWWPSICHNAPGPLTWYFWQLILPSWCITEPARSTCLWDSRTLCCCTLIPRLCKWPCICLLPHVGNCSCISWTIPSSCWSVKCEYNDFTLTLFNNNWGTWIRERRYTFSITVKLNDTMRSEPLNNVCTVHMNVIMRVRLLGYEPRACGNVSNVFVQLVQQGQLCHLVHQNSLCMIDGHGLEEISNSV